MSMCSIKKPNISRHAGNLEKERKTEVEMRHPSSTGGTQPSPNCSKASKSLPQCNTSPAQMISDNTHI